MNEYNFSRRVSTQTSTTYTNGKPFTQVIVDSNITNNNNNFKACSLDFWFNTSLVGTYTAKSKNTLVNYDELNYMNISCTVTDAAGKGAIYESIDSNTTVSITKADGKFIMNAPDGITLTKVFDDGLENAPTTMTFKCEKVR
ncbi:hypothetical protein [Flavobacterium sp.]|uniref:hypothetical protein n=1 Tax=Flavobacterium sp. TaxID=239 RepID=UPI0026389EC4|nr:hypothetical protein [Flavobacterium sp.]